MTRLGLALLLLVAGVAHFITPRPFVQHVPPVIPAAELIVAISGVVEIALGSMLIVWRQRGRLVGRLIAAFLVLVFPGNIYVAVAGVDVDGLPGWPWPWLRLLLQPLLVVSALWSTTFRETPAPGDPSIY